MTNFKKEVKLPILIHQDAKAIEAEISNVRIEREHLAKRLQSFTTALGKWLKEPLPMSADYALGFVCGGRFEADLLEEFRANHNISDAVRLEKIKEVYEVPDYTDLAMEAKYLAKFGEKFLDQFVNMANVEAPEVTKAEKEAIIEKHSVYILTESTYRLYVAISSLCDYANIINFELTSIAAPNRISLARLTDSMQLEYKRLVDWEQPEPGTTKRRFVVKYEAFKGK